MPSLVLGSAWSQSVPKPRCWYLERAKTFHEAGVVQSCQTFALKGFVKDLPLTYHVGICHKPNQVRNDYVSGIKSTFLAHTMHLCRCAQRPQGLRGHDWGTYKICNFEQFLHPSFSCKASRRALVMIGVLMTTKAKEPRAAALSSNITCLYAGG